MLSKVTAGFLLVAAILCWSACSRPSETPDAHRGFFKSPDAASACLENNLSQWELSGVFVHKLLRCASNQNDEGGETLPSTEALLASLPPEKLQNLIDFLLLPDPQGKTHEERYPYLLAFGTLLDRDLTQAPSLRGERLGALQNLLIAMKTDRAQEVLVHWARSARMQDLMRELGAFLAGLQGDGLESLTHEILAGERLRQPLLTLSRAPLTDDSLMQALAESLSATPTRVLAAADRESIIDGWRQPQLGSSAVHAPEGPTAEGQTPAQHLAAFNSSWSDADREGLSRGLLKMWDLYRSSGSTSRPALDQKLLKTATAAIDQQSGPSLWLLSMLNDMQGLRAADGDTVAGAIERLLSDAYDPTLDSLRAKMGGSRLISQIATLMEEGGAVPGCSNLSIDGLAARDTGDFASYAALVQTLTTPQSACDQKIPLEAAFSSWTGVSIDTDCSVAVGPCLAAQTRAPAQIASYWQDGYTPPSPRLLQDLVLQSLAHLSRELRADPYALRNLSLAPGSFSAEGLEAMAADFRAQSIATIEEVASFDEALTRKYRGELTEDFLEKVLAASLEKMASRASEFYDLVPNTIDAGEKTADQRASRIFAGLYAGGPLESALADRLQLSSVLTEKLPADAELSAFLRSHPAFLSSFLDRQRRSLAIFRHPAFAVQSNEDLTPFVSLGSNLNNFVSLVSDGNRHRDTLGPITAASPFLIKSSAELLQPTQAILDFDPYDRSKQAAWGLWTQQLSSSGLVSKDVPPQLAARFEAWSREVWLPSMTAAANWTDLWQLAPPRWASQSPQFSPEFFEVKPYDANEARILTLYQLRHYLKIPLPLPKGASISAGANPTPTTTQFTQALRGFMSAAYMASPGGDYTLFARLAPPFLADPSLQTLEALQSAALPDWQSFAASDQFFPYARQNLIRDVQKFSVESFTPEFKLFSTFNLLSFTRSGIAYFPQPLIGFGGRLCHISEAETAPCPVELSSASDEAAYAQYKAYIARILALHFCPLIAADDLGPARQWQERLGLTLQQPQSCEGVSGLTTLPADPLRFPRWMTQRVLDDVFAMGKEAHLKPGLAHIPAALRFYKLQKQSGLNAETRAELWLRESLGVWHNANAASQSRRQFYALQFWAGAPSLLGSWLDATRQKFDAEAWKQALAQLAEVDAEDGLRRLMRRTIDLQRTTAAEGGTMLTFAVRWLSALDQHPEERKILSLLLADYASAENYDFMGNDLPLAILGLFEDRFDWQNPGLRLAKFAAQRETLQSWAVAGRLFSPESWENLLATLPRALAAWGDEKSQERLAREMLAEGLALGTLWQSDQQRFLAQSWDLVLKSWRLSDWGESYQRAWGIFVEAWEQPLQKLDGTDGPSLQAITASNLAHLLGGLPSLLAAHQSTGAMTEDLFWPRLLAEGNQLLQTETAGAGVLARWLATDQLGFTDGERWLHLLQDSAARGVTAAALAAAVATPENLWRDALLESSDLLTRLQRPLAYLKSRLIWHIEPEHNGFRHALDRIWMLASDAQLNQQQADVLERWLGHDLPSETQGSAPPAVISDTASHPNREPGSP